MSEFKIFLTEFIDVFTLFDQPPISAFWQTYQMGVNISRVNCPAKDEKCYIEALKKDNIEGNSITTASQLSCNDLHEIEDGKFMIASMFIPMVIEIGKKVNKSIHKYIIEDVDLTSLLKSEQVDVDECKPCDYYNSTKIRKLKCTRPLYLLNQISISSTYNTKHDYNLSYILNVFHWSCYFALAVCVIFFILISSIKNPIRKSFWAYIDPLIGSNDVKAFKSFSYTLYLLALVPFIEIIRNDLLASLVTMKEIKLDTLDDLLNPEVIVMIWDEPKYWKNESRSIGDEKLKTKLESLFDKSLHTSIEGWFELFQNPNELKRKGTKIAFLYDEFGMKWAKESLGNIGYVHIGSDKYFPSLMSDICFRPNFNFIKEADEISMVYFETGLHHHLTDGRVKFIGRVAKRSYEYAKESMIETYESLNLLFKDNSNEDWYELSIVYTMPAFKLIYLLLNFSSFILVSEKYISFF